MYRGIPLEYFELKLTDNQCGEPRWEFPGCCTDFNRMAKELHHHCLRVEEHIGGITMIYPFHEMLLLRNPSGALLQITFQVKKSVLDEHDKIYLNHYIINPLRLYAFRHMRDAKGSLIELTAEAMIGDRAYVRPPRTTPLLHILPPTKIPRKRQKP